MSAPKIQIYQKKKVKKHLADIPDYDREKIKEEIEKLGNDPLPHGLEKLDKKIYRIRWGNYRIIYTFPDANGHITILYVGNRKDIYQKAHW